jgi:hypothetical protein
MRQAAAYSGLSPSHLRLLARTGRLPAWKLGQDWFTTREAGVNGNGDGSESSELQRNQIGQLAWIVGPPDRDPQ